MKSFVAAPAVGAPVPATRAQAQPDQRPAAVAQRQLLAGIAASPRQAVQRQQNRTGLPDSLKAGIENLSGHALDDVRVHRNSARPASLQAHAYAQGTDIHLAPGQEKHLPHEAWHVVQQKQGRVKPTMQLKGVGVNDNAGLEQEATTMGTRALQRAATSSPAPPRLVSGAAYGTAPVQRNGSGKEEEEPGETKPQGKKRKRQNSVTSSSTQPPAPSFLPPITTLPPPGNVTSQRGQSMEMDDDAAPDDKQYRTLKTRDANERERRVYTEQPPLRPDGERSYMQQQMEEHLRAKETKKRKGRQPAKRTRPNQEADYSYTDLATVLHNVLPPGGDVTPAHEQAISAGTRLPLTPGPVELAPGLSPDLQQVSFHLRRFQNFHTPHNLKGRGNVDANKKQAERDNRFRKQELENTTRWSQLPQAKGLKKMLPKPLDGENHNRLKNIFPGPIDVGFPPDEKKTIFGYDNLKGVFKLNKQALARAHGKEEDEREKQATRPSARRLSARRINTDAYLHELGAQKRGTLTDQSDATKRTAGLAHARRAGLELSHDGESLSEASDSESERESDGDGRTENLRKRRLREEFNPKSSLKRADDKRHTLVMTVGVLAKRTNRKLLQDRQDLEDARAKGDQDAANAAQASLTRHTGVLKRLQRKADSLQRRLGPEFAGTKKRQTTMDAKTKMLDKLKPGVESKAWDKYKGKLNEYGTNTRVGELLAEQDSLPLPGIGQKTIEAKLAREQKKKERRERRAAAKQQAKRPAKYSNEGDGDDERSDDEDGGNGSEG